MPLHKKPHKMNLSFSNYAGVIANVSLIREVAVYIYKELVATSFWNEYKQLQSPSKWISHVLLRKCFVMDLKLEVRKVQGQWCLRHDTVRQKEKIFKIHDDFVA